MYPLTRSTSRSRFFGLPFSPASLFAAGEQGFWYDPSDYSTLFQDSAGTTPVTAVEQAVGLMLDKSKGLVPFWSGYFDGTSDYLTAASNAAFTFGTGSFTVEGWHYLTAASSSTKYLFDQRVSGNGFIPALYISGGAYIVYINTAIPLSAGTVVANSWVHWALVKNSGTSTTTLYINGTSVGSFADTNNYSPAAQFRIGADYLASGLYDWQGYISNVRVVKGTAVYTSNFTPPTVPLTAISGTSLLTCQNSTFIDNSPNNFAITVNGNTVTTQRIPFGNHAFQTTSAKRPVLRARYNLLTYSEQFDNGAWTKANTTVTANAAVAPNGTTTAELARPTTTGTDRFVWSGPGAISVANSTAYTISVYAKANGINFLYFGTLAGNTTAANLSFFDLQNGVVSQVGAAFTSATIAAVGNGWYLCRATATTISTSGFALYGIADASGSTTATTSGTNGIFLWGADLRPASQATGLIGPTYQRIESGVIGVADYDAVGFLPYLLFNGLTWSMTTNNIDFTATDKMTVWAGVRKLSDAAVGQLVELSADVSANNGSFSMPAATAAGQWASFLRGSLTFVNATASGYAAPITTVNTAIQDISLSSNEVVLRINGTQAATSGASDAGTGNYGNYPLFIGARNQTILYFNGWLTSLIGRGAATSAGQISATETWVNSKTGAY